MSLQPCSTQHQHSSSTFLAIHHIMMHIAWYMLMFQRSGRIAQTLSGRSHVSIAFDAARELLIKDSSPSAAQLGAWIGLGLTWITASDEFIQVTQIQKKKKGKKKVFEGKKSKGVQTRLHEETPSVSLSTHRRRCGSNPQPEPLSTWTPHKDSTAQTS